MNATSSVSNNHTGKTETTRKVSTVILQSTPLAEIPTQTVERTVEVPHYEEVVTYVTRKEVREIEKRVPKYSVEYVDKVVEVPRVEYVDKVIEVPQYRDVVREVVVEKVVDRPVEVVKTVKVPKVTYVEKVVEVPGEVIEVLKEVEVIKHTDEFITEKREVPVIIAQTLKPVITESHQQVKVAVNQYEPEVIPVDVHIAKPVDVEILNRGLVKQSHKVVRVTAAQYNSMLKAVNTHIDAATLPYIQEDGEAYFADNEMTYIVAPEDIVVEGWHVAVTDRSVGTETEGPIETSRTEKKNRMCCGKTAKVVTEDVETAVEEVAAQINEYESDIASRGVASVSVVHYKPASSVAQQSVAQQSISVHASVAAVAEQYEDDVEEAHSVAQSIAQSAAQSYNTLTVVPEQKKRKMCC